MIIARISTFQFQPGKMEEADQVAGKHFSAMEERKVKGFLGYLTLGDRSTGMGISITLWENEADIAEFAASPLYKELGGSLSPFLAQPPPPPEVYEVFRRKPAAEIPATVETSDP